MQALLLSSTAARSTTTLLNKAGKSLPAATDSVLLPANAMSSVRAL